MEAFYAFLREFEKSTDLKVSQTIKKTAFLNPVILKIPSLTYLALRFPFKWMHSDLISYMSYKCLDLENPNFFVSNVILAEIK